MTGFYSCRLWPDKLQFITLQTQNNKFVSINFHCPSQVVCFLNAYLKDKESLINTVGMQSRPTLCELLDCKPARLLYPWNFLGKNTKVFGHFLVQEIFPTRYEPTSLASPAGRFFYPQLHLGSPQTVQTNIFEVSVVSAKLHMFQGPFLQYLCSINEHK